MVGTGEGEEAFGVLGDFVNLAGIVEGDDLIGGSVQDEKVTLQLGKLAGLAVFGEIVKEALAKLEAASCEGDLGHALGFEGRQTIAEELGNVGGIGWCANGGHPAGFRNAAGGSKHRRTTEAVTDEKRGSLVFRAQEGERLIAVVGELTGRAVRVLLRMRVVELGDSIWIEARDLGLVVDPVRAEAEGVGGEGSGESSAQRERNEGPAAMRTAHREWKTRSDHIC